MNLASRPPQPEELKSFLVGVANHMALLICSFAYRLMALTSLVKHSACFAILRWVPSYDLYAVPSSDGLSITPHKVIFTRY